MKNSTKQTIKIYFENTKGYRGQFFAIILLSIIGAGIGVILPIYYKNFFNIVSAPTSREGVVGAAFGTLWIIVCYELVRWVSWRISTVVNNYATPAMVSKLNTYCFSELHKRSFTYFNNNFVGSLVKRLNWFVRAFDYLSQRIFWDLLPASISLVGVIAVLTFEKPLFAVSVIIWLVVFLSFNWLFVRYKLKYDIKRNEAESKLSGILADSVTNHQNIKLFTGFNREVKLFNDSALDVKKYRTISWNLSSIFDGIQGLLAITLEIGIMVFGINLWKANQLTLGDFILLQSYIGIIVERTWGFGRLVRDIYESLADAEEMTTLLTTPPDILDAPNARELIVKDGNIEFKKVGFNYNETRRVFTDLDLIIPGKQKVALVGSSGSGKSTIVKLLLRMYDLTDGEIEIDGQKIHKVTQESLWNNVSLVPQDPILFHRTIKENIRYGRPEASDDDVINAAKLAHCHEFIIELKDGYNTYVGERGIKLSGGERQRVAIARAILRNAPILVLDEATSSLDSESESLIQDALNSLMKNKTVIVIAHRLSTIMKMDRIIVVDKGKIIESGSHFELLKNETGIYSNLWKIQAGGFIGGEEESENSPEEKLFPAAA